MNNEWINVKDKFPENSCDCLVYDSKNQVILIGYYQRPVGKYPARFMTDGFGEVMITNPNISYWMPLPSAPVDE